MAEKIQGLSIELGLDTIKIDSGLGELKRKLAVVNSEMKSNLSAFDKGDRSVAKYQTQISTLNKKLDVQKQAVVNAKNEYERMVQVHGEGSRQADQAARAYNNQVAAVNNLERNIEGLTAEMKELEKQQRIADSGWTKFGEKLENVGTKFQAVGGKMKDIGKSMSMYVTAPLVGFGALAAKTGIDFDDSMAKVQAVSGATGKDFSKLRDLAKDMGAKTKFSASEAADGLNYMAMAGWKTEQMVGGLPGILSLAAASGEDLGTTSDIVTDALTAFGMQAEDSGRLADVLAAASSNANTNVSMLGESFKYVAPLAGAMGYTAEDTSLALGLMANAGIKASQAGTSLKTMFANLAKPTKAMQKSMDTLGISLTDSQGNMKTMDQVLREMRGAFSGLTETQQAQHAATIFGKEAMAGALSIINASESDYEKLSEAIAGSAGAADEMAAVMEGKLGGTIREIKSGLEGFAISVYEQMLPALEKGAEKVKAFVGWLNGLSPAAKKTAVVIGGVAAAIGPLLIGFGTAAVVVGNVMTAVAPLTAAIAGAGGLAAAFGTAGSAILAFATGPIGLGIAAIAGVTAVSVGLYNHFKKDAIPEVDRFGNGVSDATKKALGGFFELSDGAGQALADMSISGKEVTQKMADDLTGKFKKMNADILDGMKKRHADQIADMEKFFLNSSALSDEREQEILRKAQVRNQAKETEQKHYEERIQQIIQEAVDEKRKITENEQQQIDAIRKQMNETAVQYLTDNERDQKVILENMKNQASALSAQQAAEVTKNSAKARDKVIADADKQLNDTVAFAIQQRDETGAMSAEEADAVIREAQKKRDETVKRAKDTHKNVVDSAKKQAGEHVGHVNWETGEILSKWEVYKNGVKQRMKDQKDAVIADAKAMWTWVKDKTTEGQNFVSTKWDNLKTAVRDKSKEALVNATRNFTDMKNQLVDKATGIYTGVKQRFTDVKTSITDTLTNTKKKALEIFDGIVKGATELPGKMKAGIVSMAGKAVDGIRDVGQKMANKFGAVVNGLIGGLNTVTSKLGLSGSIPKWTVPQFANGTDSHKGGLMVVGDKYGRELVELPTGETYLSPDTDTLLNAPKGTRVIPNRITEKYLKGDIPHFAKGAGVTGWLKDKAAGFASAMSNVWDYMKSPSKLLDLIPLPKIEGLAGGMATMAKGAVDVVKDKALEFIKSAFTKSEGEVGAKGPFPSPFRLSSRAGWRIHPIFHTRKFHYGDDWAAPVGTRIPSRSAGRVVANSFHPALGNYVDVQTGPYKFRYQHNSRNLASVGDMVKPGQTLGLVGKTGNSTGPHLHFEIRKNGAFVAPKDMGFASGGFVGKNGMYNLAEEGHGEFIIPTAPKRRTDAMKLLALAAKSITGHGGNKRPNQLPGGSGGGVFEQLLTATLEQNALLMQLLQKDTNLYVDGHELGRTVAPGASQGMHDMTNIKNLVKGLT